MANVALFTSKNLFSLASRDRCVLNMKKLAVPVIKNPPKKRVSVLITLCEIEGVVSLLYIVGGQNLGSDKGFVRFPGGKERPNESPKNTVLRKTCDDLGLHPSKIEIWGEGAAIPDYNNSTMITPVLGVIEDLQPKDFNINEKKVSEALVPPVEALCKPENQFYTQFQNDYVLPVFVAGNHKIWGLTAFLTHNFLNGLLPKTVYNNDWASKKIIIFSKVSQNFTT